MAVVVLLILAAFWALPWSAWFGLEDAGDAASAEVKEVLRGDLVISVSTQGALEAARSVSVMSEIEGQAQILKIIEEGSRVRKGDWLCTLDTTSLESQREKQSLSVERAQSSYLQAEASYNITVKQNESEIAQAELELTFAGIELDKFLGVRRAWARPGEAVASSVAAAPAAPATPEPAAARTDQPPVADSPASGAKPEDETPEEKGDREVQIQEQENKIKLARAELENAKDVFEWSEKLYAKDYITKNELERDRISCERARLTLELAQSRMRNLIDFDLRKQEKRLRADVREAELNLDRVKERCEQKRLQARTDLTSKERQLKLEKTQLERIEKQIASGTITAPQNGLVVYSNEQGRWRRGRSDPIAEGVSVRYHQKIISLPDVSEMIVEVNIHESARSLLWRGQQAMIQVEALEGRSFKGTLVKVPEVPDSSSGWLTPDRKVYKTRIRVDDASEGVRPGMSAVVKIFCEKLENVLYVPVQAVFSAGPDTDFVYVKTSSGSETRIVKVGKHNDKNVQILSGLEEGERVYLSEPPDAVPPVTDKEPKNGDEIPEGLEVSTNGPPPGAEDPRAAPSDRPRRGERRTGGGERRTDRENRRTGRGERRPEAGGPGQESARGDGADRGERESRGNRTFDPARFLERIKTRYPDLYQEVKDLPPEEQMAKIREHMQALRDSNAPGSGDERRERGDRSDRGEGGSRRSGGRAPGGDGR